MNSELKIRFEAIEAQRREITMQIEKLSDAERRWKGATNSWSALQIVEHLVLGDETVGSLTWSRRQSEISGKRPRAHPLRFKLILWALRHNVRLPVPSPEFEPRGQTTWPELKIRWEAARKELRGCLEAPDFDSSQRLYFHTIAGALSAREMMEMSRVHNAYHVRQLKRLIEIQPPRA